MSMGAIIYGYAYFFYKVNYSLTDILESQYNATSRSVCLIQLITEQ